MSFELDDKDTALRSSMHDRLVAGAFDGPDEGLRQIARVGLGNGDRISALVVHARPATPGTFATAS